MSPNPVRDIMTRTTDGQTDMCLALGTGRIKSSEHAAQDGVGGVWGNEFISTAKMKQT